MYEHMISCTKLASFQYRQSLDVGHEAVADAEADEVDYEAIGAMFLENILRLTISSPMMTLRPLQFDERG